MKKVMLVFGTRPEAIKLCPLVRELLKSDSIKPVVCVTGQHGDMLRQALALFDVAPDYDLAVMRPEQDLYDLTSAVLKGLREVLRAEKPDMVLVQGDTTTAFAAALAAYYMQIPLGHVEAGLRTNNIYSPYPEELNRQGIGLIAGLHFAPTETARENLIRGGKTPSSVFVTGNTGVDALFSLTNRERERRDEDGRLIVVTAHRRENLGAPMHGMFRAVRRIVEEFPDVRAVCPVHPNPAVREAAAAELSGCERIKLTEPMPTDEFYGLLAKSYLILTDSGGIQEEAPSLGKPVLVMRDMTERPEGVAAGTLRLVGTEERSVYENCRELLTNDEAYRKMSRAQNPYGDGRACERIRKILESYFTGRQ